MGILRGLTMSTEQALVPEAKAVLGSRARRSRKRLGQKGVWGVHLYKVCGGSGSCCCAGTGLMETTY